MTVYYINADTGDNGLGDGSAGNPWLTLAFAYSNSVAGDTIICQDSVAAYAWIDATMSSRFIQGESDDASGAVFDGAAGANIRWIISNLTISNITFQNRTSNVTNLSAFVVNIINESNTFINCVFNNIEVGGNTSGAGGLITSSLADDSTWTLVDCRISDIRTNPSIGFLFGSINATGVSYSLTGCTIYTNAVGVDQLNSICERHQPTTISFKNVIIASTYSLAMGDFTEDATYSCFYQITGAPSGTGVITSDPLMVDPDNANFNLRPTSPCIDTGTLI